MQVMQSSPALIRQRL